MTDLNEYVTETEAANLLGLAPGKGDAWRHLRERATHIELVNLFGITAVKRSELRPYAEKLKQGKEKRPLRRVRKRNGKVQPTLRRCTWCARFVKRADYARHLRAHDILERVSR